MKNPHTIHWCQVCNLLTVSRRCPICRNEVSKLDLENRGRLIPLTQANVLGICSSIDQNYGEGCGKRILPDDSVSFLDSTNDHSDIIVSGAKVGRVKNGNVTLNLSGLNSVNGFVAKNIVKCDHDSSYFVKKGHNLMVTGVREASPGLKKGDPVIIQNEKGRAIATGIMRMSSEEISKNDRGVAVSSIKSDSPRNCMNVHPHSWKDTIEVNRPTVEDSARMAVRNIKDLVSSYGSNVVIRLTGDIRDEAALLLIMDAGFIPKVIVEKRDDFIDYLLERYVLETVNSIPDSCILVADTYDGSNPGVVHHYPVSEWEPSMVWLYVFIKAVPFHPFYTRNIWNQNIE